MTLPSKLFFLDEVVKFGDTCHGLWDSTTGKVTTATSVVIDLTGDTPNSGQGGLSTGTGRLSEYGNCRLLQVPGMAAASNTTADTTAGRTWLNYGLIAGGAQRLYGKSTGLSCIYVAPDKSRWSVTINGTGGWNARVLSLVLRRFGEIGVAAQTQNIALGTWDLTVTNNRFGNAINYSNAGTDAHVPLFLEDFKDNGSKLVFSRGHWENGKAASSVLDDSWARNIYSIYELTISGQPPAATAAFVEIVNQAASATLSNSVTLDYTHYYQWHNADIGGVDGGFGTLEQQSQPTEDPAYPEVYPTNWVAGQPYIIGWWHRLTGVSQTLDAEVVIGARYSAAGAVEIMKKKLHLTTSASGTFVATFDTTPGPTQGHQTTNASVSQSQSGYIACMAGANELSRVSFTASMSVTEVSANNVWTTLIRSETATLGSLTASSTGININISPCDSESEGKLNFDWKGHSVKAVRYSNAVYGILREGYYTAQYPYNGQKVFFRVDGKIGADTATLTPSTSGWPVHCTEHPVTGTVVRATAPVCWV